ncbi:MCM DNA helicase complex subunit mcm6, partial [Ascosphaera atra]
MSSLLDAILQSEQEPGSGAAPTPRAGPQSDQPSSSYPHANSDINGATSELGHADDQIIGPNGSLSRRPGHPMLGRAPPPVVDIAGEKVQQAFEELLETHVEQLPPDYIPPSSEILSDKYYISQIHGLARYQLSTLYVDFTHLTSLPSPVLADAIAN